MDVRDVIIRPVVSEKSTDLMADNKYTFEVHRRANKYQIKDAVEEIFGVTVLQVNTQQVPGKLRRMGRTQGYTANWKKAIVKLKDGDTIEIFEGV